ncbi:hypothetical protein R6I31_003700 [Vibrio cholerae]|nr:hypothetical protein [Vibrio cholerae]ELS9246913.1 hypothetical protein [Vibrio cholerae]
MKIRTLIIISIVLIGVAQFSYSQPSDMPKFAKHESYSSIREKMIKAGWKPYVSNDADTCFKGDSRCEGRPEMLACAGTGMANCKFAWVKQENIIAICTVGEDAVFEGICSYP